MDTVEPRHRRRLLTTRPNPGSRLDYVVTVEGTVTADRAAIAGATVHLRYVPDRVLLDRGAFAAYLSVFAEVAPDGIEELAVTILDDLNDQLVARWLHVTIVAPSDQGGEHRITVEECQPHWQNPGLMSRLERY